MTAIAATIDRSSFLRRVVLVDAATCVAMGLLLSLAANMLAPLLELPVLLLEYAGLSLLPIAAFMAWVATRGNLPRLGVWVIIAGNAAWVAGSALLVVSDWASPNLLGYGFVVAQAATVALLAGLEYVGLSKT
ncbi:MAG TPA: hypothetical protein VKC64_14690 [Burkholderiales bacterium]|nr:hypothetical protein [Burkholderiales bacterium]